MPRGQDLVTENKILVLFLVGLFALHTGFTYSLLQAVHGVEEQVEEQVGEEEEQVEPPLPDSMWDAMDVSMIKEVAYRHYPELDFSEVEFVWRVAD